MMVPHWHKQPVLTAHAPAKYCRNGGIAFADVISSTTADEVRTGQITSSLARFYRDGPALARWRARVEIAEREIDTGRTLQQGNSGVDDQRSQEEVGDRLLRARGLVARSLCPG
jgi:hypothetical protein